MVVLAATASTLKKLIAPLSRQSEVKAFLTCRKARLLVSF
jgi:hypothetical protein